MLRGVGRVLRRAGLATFLGPVLFLSGLYVIGWYTQPAVPEGVSKSSRDAGMGMAEYARADAWVYRVDVGWDVLASGGWLTVVSLGSGLAALWFLIRRLPEWTDSAQLDLTRSFDGSFAVTEGESVIPGSVRTALRVGATVLAVVWLCLVTTTVLAAVIGPAPAANGASPVSTDDPAAELGADAITDARDRRHVTELWVTYRNRSSGFHRQGIDHRVIAGGRNSKWRLQTWPQILRENTTPDDPSGSYYGTPWAIWKQWPDADWRRVDSGDYQWTRSREYGVHGIGVEELRRSNASIASRNDSTVTIAYTDEEVVRSILAISDENGTGRLLITVSTTDDPNLECITVEWTRGSTVERLTYRVRDLGTATVDSPERVPATVEQLLWRTDQGIQRLASWVGL
jgi:hypothetical protein